MVWCVVQLEAVVGWVWCSSEQSPFSAIMPQRQCIFLHKAPNAISHFPDQSYGTKHLKGESQVKSQAKRSVTRLVISIFAFSGI